jgi:uncharacterized damage-inducible protein DinB
MSVIQTIQSQYHAALTMLENSIKDCPASLWEDKTYKNKYWHIVLHTLFYTHLYLSESEANFEPWVKYRKDYQYLNPSHIEQQHDSIKVYSQADLLEYLQLCRKQVEEAIPNMRLDDPAGFDWIPMTKLELLLYNLRHIQHHTGQLIDRLRETADISSAWIGKAEKK